MDGRSSQERRSPKTKAELLDEIDTLRARIEALETESAHAEGADPARNAVSEPAGGSSSESGEIFRKLIEGSSIGIMILRDFKPVFVNPSFAEVFGYDSPQEVMELESVMELPVPDERARVRRLAVDRMGGKDSPKRYEYEGLKKDGSSIWLDNHVRVVTWEGEPAILSTVLDITDRMQAEEQSRRLSGAIRNLSELFVLWDADDRLVLCNDRFREINAPVIETTEPGTLFEDHIRAALSKGLYPEAIGREKAWLRERVDRHRNPSDPFEVQRQDGRWLLIREQRMPDGSTATLSTDVSNSKQTEKALRESEARFKDFADTAADWFWEMGPDLRFTYMSERVENVVGVPAAFHIGKTREELAGEAIKDERWQSHLEDLRQRKPFRNFSFLRKGHDGRLQYLSTSGIPIYGDDGTFLGYRGSATDVSERIAVDQIKNEFVSTVSHELRTPLTSIKGALGLIKGGAIGSLPSDVQKMLEIAYNNSDRLIGLINDILDMEKIEAGKLDFNFHAVELVSLIRHAIEANKGYADEFGVDLVLKEHLPAATVWADDARLMQVMSNLISNAAKFSKTGDTVEIEVSEQQIGGVHVAVRDHGAGISSEFHDTIFDRFTQADSSDVRHIGGTGLGLSISRAIIDRHGGTIDFDTEVGKGTTFYFSLPTQSENLINP